MLSRKTCTAALGLALGMSLAPSISHADVDSSDAWYGKNDRDADENGYVIVTQPLITTATQADSRRFNWTESRAFGNERWGAGYDLAASTAVTQTAGRIQSAAGATFSSWGKVFGNYFRVVDLTTSAFGLAQTGSAGRAGLTYQVYVGGQLRKTGTTVGGDYKFKKNVYDMDTVTIGEYTKDFTVGWVPVTVTAALYLGAGIDLSGRIWTDGLDVSVIPNAGLYVTARGGVGWSGFSGGVYVDELSLLEASLPVTTQARWAVNIDQNGQCVASVSPSINLDLKLTTLSGSIGIYWDSWFYSDSTEIAKWDGYSRTFNIGQRNLTPGAWYVPDCSILGAVAPTPAPPPPPPARTGVCATSNKLCYASLGLTRL
jgi:hypothetical protein